MKGRILVIDDDADIRETLQLTLELHSYQVETLGDGIAATQLKRRYDAILLDLRMPIFDGERLTDYWVMTDPDVLDRVIVMSGYSDLGRREFPVFATVQKPYDPEELLRVVAACVSRHRETTASQEDEV